MTPADKPCTKCHGTGIGDVRESCDLCLGTGRVERGRNRIATAGMPATNSQERNMTPADRREVCAILRRFRDYVQIVENGHNNEMLDAMQFGRELEGEIERIEKEIEPCQDEPADSPKHVPPDATGSRGTSASGAGSAPPDLDAIRTSIECLEDVLEACGYDQDENTPPWAVAARRLVALDVPGVVAALMDEAKGEAYIAGCERADRIEAQQRAEAAEARVKEVEDLAAVYDSDKNLPRHFMRVVAERNAERIRAEAAEALADLAELVRHDTERKLTAMQQERDEARAEKAEALEREHEQARKA